MAEPSPRPWKLGRFVIRDANEEYVSDTIRSSAPTQEDIEQGIANAAHIVRCVNAHEKLVEHLTCMCDLADLQDAFTEEDEIAFLRKAKAFLEEIKQ